MLSFIEYIAACESEDFPQIDEGMLEWAREFVKSYDNIWEEGRHDGDCTNEIHSCPFCVFEALLTSYRRYIFKNKTKGT